MGRQLTQPPRSRVIARSAPYRSSVKTPRCQLNRRGDYTTGPGSPRFHRLIGGTEYDLEPFRRRLW